MKLTAPGVTDLTFNTAGTGIGCRIIDVGWPVTRAVVSPRSLADGTDDRTAYIGARSVALTCFVHDDGTVTREQWRDRLAQFCHPALRPTLHYASTFRAGDPDDRIIGLRPLQGQAVIDNTITGEIMVTFEAPTGLIEAATASTDTVPPPTPAAGEAFDWEFPVVWPAAAPTPTVVTALGSMAASPTLRIDGPVVSPAVTCGTAVVSFPGLDIEAGHWLTVDMAARTVLLDDVTDRRAWLDPTVSTWWQLQPGANDVLFTGGPVGDDAEVTVTWRDTYFL